MQGKYPEELLKQWDRYQERHPQEALNYRPCAFPLSNESISLIVSGSRLSRYADLYVALSALQRRGSRKLQGPKLATSGQHPLADS